MMPCKDCLELVRLFFAMLAIWMTLTTINTILSVSIQFFRASSTIAFGKNWLKECGVF